MIPPKLTATLDPQGFNHAQQYKFSPVFEPGDLMLV